MSLPRAFSCALLAFSCTAARAQTDALSREAQSAFARCEKAIVKIEAVDDHGKLSGTGFFIDPSGTLYTCYSVGGESRDIVVTAGERKYPATRLVADSHSGIAVLKIEGKTPYLPVGNSKTLAVAGMIMTIGYPLDLAITPNIGCIGGFQMKHANRYFAAAHIRASVPVQRGEGGAPLLTMNGEVVGVVVSSVEGGAGCFALPIEAAEKVRKDYLRFGEVRRGWLGIKFTKADGAKDGSAVRVDELIDGSPAGKFGLKAGDFLLRVGEAKIAQPDDVLNAAFYLTAGDEVAVTVSREGEKIDLTLRSSDEPGSTRETAFAPVLPGGPLRASQ